MTTPGPFLLFDFGGTLVDLRALPASLVAVLRNEIRHPRADLDRVALSWVAHTAELLPDAQGPRFAPEKEIAVRALDDVLRKTGLPLNREAIARVVRTAWRRYASLAVLHADATLSLLGSLRPRCQGMALVSDGDDDAVPILAERLGVAPYFDAIITTEAVRAYKPDPAVYRAALKSLRASPERCLFISDSLRDLEGARALGIRTALISRSSAPGPEPQGDFLVLRSLGELPRVLDSFNQSGPFRLRGR